MSNPNTHKRGNKTPKRASSFVPLVNVWRKQYEILANHLRAPSEKSEQAYLQAHQRWNNHVRAAVNSHKINDVMGEQKFADQREKSYCVQDILNVCIEKTQRNHTYRLWGLPITGLLPQLLAAVRSGDEFAKILQQMINAPVAFMGAVPSHIACVLSPQAMADLTTFAPQLFTSQGEVNGEEQKALFKIMEPYVFQSHCDLEKVAQSPDSAMGTIVCLFVSSSTQETPPLFDGQVSVEMDHHWNSAVQQWKEENQASQLFFSKPERLTRSIVLGAQTLLDFTWGMNARASGNTQSVLTVERVFVDYQPNQILLTAYTEESFYASAALPIETTMWPLHLILDNLADRGVRLLNQKDDE